MINEIYFPTAPLNYYINYFFYYEGYEASHNLDRFLPDGSIELIFNLTEIPQYIHDNNNHGIIQKCTDHWISGIRTKPITIPSGNQSKMLIVFFKQGKTKPFLNMPVIEITDKVLDADDIFGNSINDLRYQIIETETIEQKFKLLENYLKNRISLNQMNSIQMDCIDYAVNLINSNPHRINLEQLTRDIGYSRKHFIEIFKNNVGINPKTFTRITKFQRIIAHLQNCSSDWITLSMDNGFFDQSHLINDFKHFAEFTPTEYLSKKTDFLNYVNVG